MEKLQIKEQNKALVPEKKATKSKTPVAVQILALKNDGNEKTSQSSTDRNHNKILRTNYGCRTKGESDEVEVHTGAIANSIKTKIVAINDLTKTGDSGEAHEGSAEPLNSMIVDVQRIQKPWQKVIPRAREYHHPFVAHMMRNGYSPAYLQMMTTSWMQSKVTGANIDFEMRRRRPCYWRGELPPRNYCNPVFSSKVFVGGVPWDITEAALLDSFSKYGTCRVEWPGKELYHTCIYPRRPKVSGYVYMIFENDRAVKKLLQDCSQEFGTAGEWYFKLAARRSNGFEIRQVQIIPWVITDASYIFNLDVPVEPKKTVFVGALHGMITAQVLFSIMRDVYGDVIFVGIDTDRQKYPIGSARVTFATHSAYFRAIESGYLEIHTSKFTKKVQIDPFLEDAKCSQCECVQGPYFCREKSCFKYFCLQCWEVRHSLTGPYGGHKPMIRTHRRSVLSESYFAYSGVANCAIPYDLHSIVPQQYFGTVASEIGIQMNMRPTFPDHIAEITKSASVKLTFGQPAYLLPTYSNHPLKQVQVWVPPPNQGSIVSHESNPGAQTLNSTSHVPWVSSSLSETHSGSDHNDSVFCAENIVDQTLSEASGSSSSSRMETV